MWSPPSLCCRVWDSFKTVDAALIFQTFHINYSSFTPFNFPNGVDISVYSAATETETKSPKSSASHIVFSLSVSKLKKYSKKFHRLKKIVWLTREVLLPKMADLQRSPEPTLHNFLTL
jgi:hypothetical protein